MEPSKKSIKDAIDLRDEIIETFKDDNIGTEKDSEGYDIWYKRQESKQEIDKEKGYASFELKIDPLMEKNYIEYFKKVIGDKSSEMNQKKLFAGFDKGMSADDPDMEIIRFVIELNPGDYNSIGLAISEKEREAMIHQKSAYDLYLEDRKEEERNGGPRHY